MLDILVTYQDKGIKKQSSQLIEEAYVLKFFEKDNGFKILIQPNYQIEIEKVEVILPYKYEENASIFLNGYQSWTETREFSLNEQLRDVTKLPKFLVNRYGFDKYGDVCFKKYQKEILHGYTYSYVKQKNPIFIGSNNEKNSFLIVNHDHNKNRIVLESIYNIKINNELVLMDVMIEKDVKEGIIKYFSQYQMKKVIPLKGYTSWYNHYQNINENLIMKTLESIDSSDYNLFQIDDGFEEFVGDWNNIDRKKFPNGLESIVTKIHQKKMLAGIWLAPFVCEKKSKLFKERKDLLAKDKNGNFIKAGCNWSGFYVLDVTKEETKKYIVDVLNSYISMGFDFFKLDFLYAASLISHPYKTRAMIIYEIMKEIREVLKDKLILGCGVPLSSVFNLVDYCRIGPDVSLKFDDAWYMKYTLRERLSTKVTIQNTIFRHHLSNHVFLNDPDVVILRENNNKLTSDQKDSLLTINILFGDLFMSSDDTSNYSYDTREKIKKLFALKEQIKERKVKRNKDTIIIELKLKNMQVKTLIYQVKNGKLTWIN